MAEFFEMPQASPTMEVGVVLSWKKQEGEAFAPQDVIAEVETDKAAMDVEVFDNGVLLKILAEEGEEVPAGSPIAIVGTDASEDISSLMKTFEANKGTAAKPVEAPETPVPGNGAGPAVQPPKPAPTPVGVIEDPTWMGKTLDPAVMEPPAAYQAPKATIRASPLARKIAADRGIALGQVRGSGPHGRIVRADLENTPSGPAPAPTPGDQVVRNSLMRKTIARRLKQAYLDAPVFFLTAVIDCEAAVTFRQLFKDAGMKVSYNDLVIKACAMALRDVPEVNASWGEDAITRHGRVDIGVAVALEDGLITPVVNNADIKSLSLIASESRELAGRAREMKLAPEEYTGSTFTISNLGMMGIEEFTAILNPPESCILAVGAMTRELVPQEGSDDNIEIRHRMRVTLTCDHRVVDGALGARFLQAMKGYMEQPARMT